MCRNLCFLFEMLRRPLGLTRTHTYLPYTRRFHSRRECLLAQAAEFAAIGLLSGVFAAIAASVLAGVVATRVFDLPWQANWGMAAVGAALGVMAALARSEEHTSELQSLMRTS